MSREPISPLSIASFIAHIPIDDRRHYADGRYDDATTLSMAPAFHFSRFHCHYGNTGFGRFHEVLTDGISLLVSGILPPSIICLPAIAPVYLKLADRGRRVSARAIITTPTASPDSVIRLSHRQHLGLCAASSPVIISAEPAAAPHSFIFRSLASTSRT